MWDRRRGGPTYSMSLRNDAPSKRFEGDVMHGSQEETALARVGCEQSIKALER